MHGPDRRDLQHKHTNIDLLKQLERIRKTKLTDVAVQLSAIAFRRGLERTAVDPHTSSFDRARYLVSLVRIASPHASPEA
eukprot:COSAG02_NODE_46720_length_346_cov_1.469636_2_plen_79_part_01